MLDEPLTSVYAWNTDGSLSGMSNPNSTDLSISYHNKIPDNVVLNKRTTNCIFC